MSKRRNRRHRKSTQASVGGAAQEARKDLSDGSSAWSEEMPERDTEKLEVVTDDQIVEIAADEADGAVAASTAGIET